MAIKMHKTRLSVLIFLIYLCMEGRAKNTDNKTSDTSSEVKTPRKATDGAALMFADEFKQTLEKYLFGICPQNYKIPAVAKNKNLTFSCDLDTDQQELAGRLATLALRAHTAGRSDCGRLSAALANTLGELARTAAQRQVANGNGPSACLLNSCNKKKEVSRYSTDCILKSFIFFLLSKNNCILFLCQSITYLKDSSVLKFKFST
ncbi:hypothetical protein K1T71_014378 [Dendrolimus kikuchii]|uniref:Uncharacterized protein n=1 Tax=Dendrolimus kikuchii TaxID=765133 RepID=A0ACC1CDY1_9NEOP|nr:hypothetical protein K1T71_014378 [Dendrolimus kikuchii]